MSLLHTQEQIQTAPVQRANLEASTRLHSAEAGLKESELRINERVAARMSALGQGQEAEVDPINLLEQAGTIRLQAGDTKGGSELINRATMARTRQATEAYRQAQTERQSWLTVRDQSKRVADLAGTVTDQASYDRMKMLAQGEGMDVSEFPPDYVSAAPLLSQLSQTTMTAYQKANLKLTELRDAERALTQRNVRDFRKLREPLLQAQTRAAEELAKKREREGVAPLLKDQELAVGKFIKSQLPDLDAAEAARGAVSIAIEARRLIRQNPGLTWDQAVAKAFDPEDFTIQGGAAVPLIGQVGGKKVYAPAPGKSPEKPMALPAKPDASLLKDGKYYQTKRGIAKWDAKSGKFMPAASAGGGLIVPSAMDDDEEED